MDNEETAVNFQRFCTLIFYGNLIIIVGMVLRTSFQFLFTSCPTNIFVARKQSADRLGS